MAKISLGDFDLSAPSKDVSLDDFDLSAPAPVVAKKAKDVSLDDFDLPVTPKTLSLGDQLLAGQPPQETPPTTSFPRENFTPERFPEITLALPQQAPAARFNPTNERDEVMLAAPEEIESAKKRDKEIRTNDAKIRLLDQAVNAIVEANMVGKAPGTSHYSKERIADIMEKFVSPFALGAEPQGSLTQNQRSLIEQMRKQVEEDHAPQEAEPAPEKKGLLDSIKDFLSTPQPGTAVDYALAREEHPGIKKAEEAVAAPLQSSLDFADLVLNAPVRPLAETFETMRKAATWYAQGMEGSPPEWHPLDAIMRNPGASTGFPEFFQNSLKQAVGGRDLTGLEHVLSTALGIPFDVGAGGGAWRAVMPYKNVPAKAAIQHNIEKPLERAGVPVGTGIGQVHPARVEAAAARTAAPTAHADRVRIVREEMAKIGRMVGMNPRQLQQLDAHLIRQLGDQGRFLEKMGNYPAISSKLFPLKNVSEIQHPSVPGLAYGAGQVKGPLREAGRAMRSMFAADRGAPEGVQDVIRKAEGEVLSGTAGVTKNARIVGRSFGKDPARGEQVMLYLDAKATRNRADKYMNSAEAAMSRLENDLDVQVKEVEKALSEKNYEAAKDAVRAAEDVVGRHPGVSRQGNKGLVSGVRTAYRQVNKAKAATESAASLQASMAVARKKALDLAPRVISAARNIVRTEMGSLQQGYVAARKSLDATTKGVNSALDAFLVAERAGDQAAMGIARTRLSEALVSYGRGYEWGRRGFLGERLGSVSGETHGDLSSSVAEILSKEASRIETMTEAARSQITTLRGKVELAAQGIEKIQDLSPKFVRDRIVEINRSVREHFSGLNWTEARKAKGELPEAAKAAKAGLTPWKQAEAKAALRAKQAEGAGESVLKKLRAPISKEEARLRYYRQQHGSAIARHEEMALKGWDLKTPAEKKAWEFMQEEFERAYLEEKAILGTEAHLDDYIPRGETTASKLEKAKLRSRASSTRTGSGKWFTKPRKPWEAGINLGGTDLTKFELHPGAIYAKRMIASKMQIGTALAEQNTLNAYGTRMVNVMEDGKIVPMTEKEVQAAVLGRDDVKIWVQKTGKDAGDVYLLDPRADDLLSKTFDPKLRSQAMQTYREVLGWWKARATVSKLSFVNRNFFLGNLMNMGLGGVKVHRLDRARDAKRVLAVWEAQHFGEKTLAEKLDLLDVLGGSVNEDTKVFGGRRIGDVIEMLKRNKVTSPGQVAYEMGTAGAETAPKANWKQWRPWKPDFPLKNQLWNPMSSSFAPMKAISKINQEVENFSKVWTFMDTIAEGGQEWEASRKVADFLFNYDEMSRVLDSPATDLLTAFPKWGYKNYGLQFASVWNRPDKLAELLSLESGYEELDPTDAEDFSLAMDITKAGRGSLAKKERVLDDDVAANEFTRLPFTRGAEGSRQYFPKKGATPQGALGSLMLHKLFRGDVSDWAEGVAMSLQDWLGPWQNYLANRFVMNKTDVEPTFSGSRRGGGARYTTAPTSVSMLMDYLQDNHPKLHHLLTEDSPWVRPKKVLTDDGQKTVKGEYIWDSDFKDFLEGADPGFSVIRRIWPPGEDAQMYSGRHSVFGLGKPVDMTIPRLMFFNEQSMKKNVIDPIRGLKKQKERGGEGVPLQ